MRLILAATAFAAMFMLGGGQAHAQSLQCRQQTTPEQREYCAEGEIDDLDDQVKYWRSAARQNQNDYDYFAHRRERCDGEFACIARELQTEISELQVKIEPAARVRVRDAYVGPIVYHAVTPMTELDRVMDRVVTRDSWGWMFNRYDRGSVRNTRVEARVGRDRLVYSDYTYNGGTPGWVRLYIIAGVVNCVEYHDFPNTCRPVGARSYSHGITSQLLAMAAGY